MENSSDKDKRIRFLEEIIPRLLKERNELENRARILEGKLKAQKHSDNTIEKELKKEIDFLNQFGELIRPIIHDIKGQIIFLENTAGKTIDYLKENRPGSNFEYIINLLNLNLIAIERLKRRLTEISYLGGKVPDLFTRIQINELIKENIELIKSFNPDVHINLDLSKQSIEILGDKESLNQIIMNLLINAIEACTCLDSSKKHISLTTKINDDDPKLIQIIVKDNGIGIYPEELNKIYNLYYTTKKTGFGIGLYLVKRAVQLHKGKITCESTPNNETSFTVTLPISSEDINGTT